MGPNHNSVGWLGLAPFVDAFCRFSREFVVGCGSGLESHFLGGKKERSERRKDFGTFNTHMRGVEDQFQGGST